jgi:hypothetical protein
LPPQILDYSDYHRTVIGYHGTDRASADRLVCGEPFKVSDEDNEWFGQGIYFWEHAYQQAWWWAREHKRFANPAVIGAVIRLGACFDLVDPGNITRLKAFHDALAAEIRNGGDVPPVNVRNHRLLDCAVFNYIYEQSELAKKPLDTARGIYIPTSEKKRVYQGSWISVETHIQLCVRNPRSILAVWHVREDGRYGVEKVEPNDHGE